MTLIFLTYIPLRMALSFRTKLLSELTKTSKDERKTSKVAIMDRYPNADAILWPRIRQYTVSDTAGDVLVDMSYSSGVHRGPAKIWGFAMTALAKENWAPLRTAIRFARITLRDEAPASGSIERGRGAAFILRRPLRGDEAVPIVGLWLGGLGTLGRTDRVPKSSESKRCAAAL
jgi:hypothetical protein